MATTGRVYSSRAPIVTLHLLESPCFPTKFSSSVNVYSRFLHNIFQCVDGCLCRGECLHLADVEGCLYREVCFHIDYFMLEEIWDFTAGAWPQQDEFSTERFPRAFATGVAC